MQSRLTTGELAINEIRAQQSAMRLMVQQLSGRVSDQANDVSRIRSALVAAVTAVPSRPRPGGGSSGSPRIESVGSDLTIKAPLGTIGIQTDGCVLDDLCTATAFAETLQDELRNIGTQ